MDERAKAVAAALGSEIPFVLITARDVIAIHDEMISMFGGTPGVRDRDGLLSAVGRQLHTATYGACNEQAIAASLAYGLCQNHAFMDGNKRSAFGAMLSFLTLNDIQCDYDPVEAQQVFVMLAAGQVSESDLTEWVLSICIGRLSDDAHPAP